MHSIDIARTAIGIAVLAAASFQPAHAAPEPNWAGYAGVNCVPSSSNHSVRRSVVGGQPIFGNQGSSTITVFCPVTRHVSEGGTNRVQLVRVRLRNRAAVSTRCEFRSHDISGNTVDVKSALFPTGETVQSMGPLNASNWGSYSLNCQLPGLVGGLPSYIVNYRVDEL